ncbi:cupin domain-containing protein [Myxococcus sp. K38C18041901]|uniref:(R)-mandelonitrile lyase n=1 Tax=Myxococcus guangdongensis TaxID=2906760 RepID=UPI0020A7906A|nr:antibiotic biosynthesis monooxygenase [Myxococcus guangdongensis]MCP3064164.1 cupin domain-containing protein [Myxococcus guangdongensis]
MRTPFILTLLLSSAGCRPAQEAPAAPAARADGKMTIQRSGSQLTRVGPAANFTGTVTVVPLFQAMEHRQASAASVSFAPNARSAWHTHPAGQTLVVTSGTGWVQQWGGEKQEIRVGDVIWTPPGVKHWHGATSTTAMTHTAQQESVDGKVVEWLEHVTDEQYGVAPVAPSPASAASPAVSVRIAELDIDPARLAAYLAIVRPEMTESVRTEPGVIALQAVAEKDNPAKLTFVELYADEAAYELHRSTPHFQHYLKATSDMIVSRRLREAVPVQLSIRPTASE